MTGPVRTTCPYCGVGCGLKVTREADGRIRVEGDEAHPANRGRICIKGASLAETIGLEGRLLHPEIRGRRASWDKALDEVAEGFTRTIREHGPDSVAFYVSGQLLTEDYYVANKLMKGFIGSANIDTNSRLCMASSVAGHKRAFGADIVPGSYEDIDLADLIVLVGSNAAWCHPVLHQRIVERRASTGLPRVVVIDPRRTASCEDADLHLPLVSGTDAVLFNGLLLHVARSGRMDEAFSASSTEGRTGALAAAADSTPTIEDVAAACGLDADHVRAFYQWFAVTERVVTLYSQGINQSSSGTDKVNAIINCHLATGRIAKPGAGPFSLTGQPNAMGGREVGGLANQLAAHMEIANADHRALVRNFWKAPNLAAKVGLKAVEMFDAMARGEIKAVWIMCTNPAASLPNTGRVKEALATCPLVVVSDCMRNTDTTQFAHVLLPAAAWGEKDGTVTNSERRISRQRPFLPPPGEAKPDWWMVCEVAKRMGLADAFAYDGPAAIFREHAMLSGEGNNGARAFDISGLVDADYDSLAPVQWPVNQAAPNGTARIDRFYTADGKARFVAVVPRAPAHPVNKDYPLALNTGRIRDHWHTMTRTGMSPRLSSGEAEPYLEIHPEDASECELIEGGLARIESRWGATVARVRMAAGQRRGEIFAPIHWTETASSSGHVGLAVNPARDPVSGQPELKHTPVRVEPYAPKWHGFALSQSDLVPDGASYWARALGAGFVRYELAGDAAPADWDVWARRFLGAADRAGEWISYRDTRALQYRFAELRAGRLTACLFIAPRPELLPPRDWLGQLFGRTSLSPQDRMGVLAGREAA